MMIQVVGFATLRQYLPESGRWMDVPEGIRLGEIIQLLQLPEQEVQLIMRNHQPASRGDVAIPNDRIVFIPVIDGG